MTSAPAADPTKLYPETLKRLAEPLFAQGESRVFLGRCCGRVYVGALPAHSCKTCGKPFLHTECSTLEQVLTLADP